MLLEVPLRPEISLLLPAVLLLGACDRQSADNAQASANVAAETAATPPEFKADKLGQVSRDNEGEAAPDTPFTAPDGSETTLAAFRGKPVLVNLWATWCAPCVAEMPTLDALAEREGERLQVLVISQDMDGAEKVAPFFEKAAFKRLQPYLEPGMALSVGYGANLPTTILYDAEGKEVWRVLGDTDWTGKPAADLIAEAI
ncbi:Thiol:disulfide oxidoreductase TlpA [Sphingomonas sp. AX6]|nr:Thiol:disulfide oxidoreductase TlpA [Sphingomonas sp. AX6]